MADYFVASGGSNTAPYDTWAKAATSLQTALTAATGTGDRVVIQYDGVPSGDAELAATTTYTFGGNVILISSTNSGTATVTPTVMGTTYWIGNSTTARGILLEGAYKIYIYGITFRCSSSTAADITLFTNSDATDVTYDNVYFWQGSTNNSSDILIGNQNSGGNSFQYFKNCTLRLGNTGQFLTAKGGSIIFESCTLSSAGSAPTTLLGFAASQGQKVLFNACDLSHCTGTLVGNNTIGSTPVIFTNCKLGSTFTALASQTLANAATSSVEIYNSSGADQHYHFGFYNAFGEATVSTGIYATDAAANNKYDGANRCSWKVVTTANCSYYTPFATPWFETYHSGTSAITPSIEVLADRTGSPFKDDEIWGEWSYQGTSGSTQASFVNDRRGLASAAANQANSSLTASDWTGETAGSPTPWFGKLAPASTITPAEIGMLRARVCVGKASTTVYVDPSVRYS